MREDIINFSCDINEDYPNFITILLFLQVWVNKVVLIITY